LNYFVITVLSFVHN